MMRLKLALVILGGVLIYFGVQEYRLSGAAREKPQNITCAELIENGPGDNAHVIMNDFLICDMAYVYEEQRGGKWSKVWVPAVPLGGKYHLRVLSMMDEDGHIEGDLPKPTDIRLIVKSDKVHSEADLTALGDLDSIQGVIVNKIESLHSDEKKILEDSYPAVDFDKCLILEVDRKPATMAKLAGFGGGGLALLVVGLVLMFRGWMPKHEETPMR